MESLEKKVYMVKLFNLYGYFLSNAQKEIMNDYYFLDLSISEISENRGISRSAVEDALKKATTKLSEYEENLKYEEKQRQLRDKLVDLREKTDDEKVKTKIEKILEELDYGI